MRLKKWLIGFGIAIAALFLVFKFVAWPYMKGETKKISPQKTETYTQNSFDLKVAYSSPKKKGRVIFGELVPYNVVWRTGANEPTTFTTASDIKIIDKKLPAGSYSLWTIPNKNAWSVIFNSEIPEWGVTLLSGGAKTTRNEASDVVVVEVPARSLSTEQESLAISFETKENFYLSLSWDQTEILVPLNK
jgi:hypothetical protein